MEELKRPSVHLVLAQSYLAYFLLCSFGLFLDTFFPMSISLPHAMVFAAFCFALGPFLILWAQYTSHRFEIVKQQTGQPQFNRGPYRYLRNPTQLGLLILVGGYALATQAATLFIATGIAYIISNVFYKRHEAILESRYGERYQAYKASVPKIM